MGAEKERGEPGERRAGFGGRLGWLELQKDAELLFVCCLGQGIPDTECRETTLTLQDRSKMLASCREPRQTGTSLLSFLLGPIVHTGSSRWLVSNA